MAGRTSRTRTKIRRARSRNGRERDEPTVTDERTTEEAEAEQKPGRLAQVGAGWKVISGAVATIATAVGVLTTFGLVGGGDAPSPTAAVASAASKTADASSSKVQVTVIETPAGAAAGSGGTTIGVGEFDYRRGRGRMEYDLSRREGSEDLYAVEVRLNGPSFFVRDPGGPNAFRLGKGKTWLRVAFAELSAIGDTGFAAVVDPLAGVVADPTKALEGLAASTSGAKLVGEEPYYGVKTKHYRAQRDPDGRGPARPTTVDVWIDEKGFLRKLETVTRDASGSTTTRTELDEFGVEVDAELPPRSRVFDFGLGE